ncbi:hydroxymethylglutaryl-CoA lyase [Marivirga tractuosa]|uniref:Hydroxymethylglutaryl-CoA lyase n=1 Tax=Marivirga tractuosa (strain ATCC 23168 / DSM 4126 / NBRC 15989 / NCIMB 1408 / VKM B-1430 / H-43) TaxID=643867 RepID=E4TT50_MARTH|nr:hydroxymethylglutaryl-CoA lyase [Marivirga tractuosa]ADR20898.1 Hydroxymethylglutaryl-CoA lyase [Marivirga tractuosa DSM 4126]BDD14651.1 hydroxymethylglutaryl-CoA lyase [Marivirga tractuosa]
METKNQNIKLIECPRDAMQGLHDFIPTQDKIKYLNQLLKVGFDTIDAGSFVSPKAIPQMKDSAEVFDKIDWQNSTSKLLAIIANQRGASDAVKFEQIAYLGYPLSLSETFQQRNTKRSITTAMEDLKEIQELTIAKDKTLVVYLSMGFGNPYGDPYDAGFVQEFVEKLEKMGVKIISLSDTIGVSNAQNISWIFNQLISQYPDIEFGAHLHSNPATILEKVEAAYSAGCRRFDGAIKGFGGCPMAEDDLVGNMVTEDMVAYFNKENIELGINQEAFIEAQKMALEVFPAR